MPLDTWTGDLVADVTRLWAAGHSATSVGEHLGLTRNAVIGKINRLGLPAPDMKRPVISDRAYSRQCPEIIKARASERQRRYREKKKRTQALDAKRAVRARFLARGATKTSREYRVHMPRLADMTKGELRAMLSQAVQNTAAMGIAA